MNDKNYSVNLKKIGICIGGMVALYDNYIKY